MNDKAASSDIARKIRLYFVMGELSGDNLGADLIDGLVHEGLICEPLGLGGQKMQAKGLISLFDITELSVMGVSGVVAKLPKLLKRVRQVAADIVAKEPDMVVLIDSPEFAFAVAKRVKKQRPDLPIIKYVCPTVWAWRPGRAPKLKLYLDHILAILPFEPRVVADLGGPDCTYIGHPLCGLIEKTDALDKTTPGSKPVIAVCPGSRKSEVTRLLPILRETIQVLAQRGQEIRPVIPVVPHLQDLIRGEIQDWAIVPELVLGDDGRASLFMDADAALAASGTVTLELAMYKTPMVSIYKLDRAMAMLQPLFKAWTASLPNMIADTAFVPERINRFAHPENIARTLERIIVAGPARDAQLHGFAQVISKMKQKEPPNLLATHKILDLLEQSPRR